MQRITTYIILVAVFFSGALLLYRTLNASKGLSRVEAVVVSSQMDSLYAHKGRTYYAYTFSLQDRKEKLGIYNGTDAQPADEALKNIEPGRSYIFFMDPTVETANGVNLGLREVRDKETVLYQDPVAPSIMGGLILCLISLVGGLLMWRYYRLPKPKRLIPF